MQFQYISCYCLSRTSCYTGRYILISIHLMLLFIVHLSFLDAISLCNFNTSHVTVYLPHPFPRRWCMLNFNTSHVTVYQNMNEQNRNIQEFQYISCYCLSPHPFPRRWCMLNFNTSHVTVYPRQKNRSIKQLLISIHLMLLFIL